MLNPTLVSQVPDPDAIITRKRTRTIEVGDSSTAQPGIHLRSPTPSRTPSPPRSPVYTVGSHPPPSVEDDVQLANRVHVVAPRLNIFRRFRDLSREHVNENEWKRITTLNVIEAIDQLDCMVVLASAYLTQVHQAGVEGSADPPSEISRARAHTTPKGARPKRRRAPRYDWSPCSREIKDRQICL